jgi:hypothetical protein
MTFQSHHSLISRNVLFPICHCKAVFKDFKTPEDLDLEDYYYGFREENYTFIDSWE